MVELWEGNIRVRMAKRTVTNGRGPRRADANSQYTSISAKIIRQRETAAGFSRLPAEKAAKPMPIPLPLTEPLSDLLSASQAGTLRAAIDRIIPADDAPGGWEAGVGDYFARLWVREPQFLVPARQGLNALDAEARATAGNAFASLAPATQDALLARVEAGDVQTDWPQPAADFFRRLVSQAMEGFYADPGNGGNKDGVAWRMIGFRVTA